MKSYAVRRSQGEPDWARAVLLTDFAFPWEASAPPSTEFRAVHDGRLLYFRFDCVDRDLVLATGSNPKQRVLGSDRVEIFFAPSRSLDPYYCMEMTPSGDVYAYRARTYRKFDDAFAFHGLVVQAAVRGDHYMVQGCIGLETLRSLGVLGTSHGLLCAGLYRAEFSHRADGSVHRGWMSWVDPGTAEPDFHVPSSFGVLELE